MKTLDEILRQAAQDMTILSHHGWLFGKEAHTTMQATAKLLSKLVQELDTTNMIQVQD